MYLLISFLLGVFAFICTVSWKSVTETAGIALISGIITFLISCLILWLGQPVLGFSYFTWLWILLIPVAVVLICRIVTIWDYDLSFANFVPLIIWGIGLLYGMFSSTGLFVSRSMQEMLDLVEVSDTAYVRDVAQIQPESMILVDEELARKYADATLEQDPATGSICRIDNLSIQNLNGTFEVQLADGQKKTLTFHNEQVYVAPLEHRGFFKWRRKKTTPGYILVSAMKQNVVYFVRELNGEPLKLRYLESSFFGSWWKRYLRHHGYLNVRFADSNIELDDTGRPFMVVPIRENTTGYTCPEITKVVILDVQNGDIEEYSKDKVPEWVDRVYPSSMIEKRIEWWGTYQNGFWNGTFAQVDVRSQTPGIEQVYTDGDCYWYTGIMSAGADDGTSGFMLTNTRTGKSKLYAISGVNEEASRTKISNYKIDAADIEPSRVLMYNIKNEPTYFATCKSESGEFMGYAFSSVKYRDVCGVGKTVYSAYDAYCAALRSSRNDVQLDGKSVENQKRFVVQEITKENGNYYFLFKGENGKEFGCPTDISPELKWTIPGDSVAVTFEQGMSNLIILESFDNLRVNL